jgi:predicted NBD/HSP70 family sugar kinase
MPRTIGVLAVEQIAVGLVEDNQIVGAVQVFPEAETGAGLLEGMHAEDIVQRMQQEINLVRQGEPIAAVGVGFPGIIRDGLVEECPNLPQVKGHNLAGALATLLRQSGLDVPVHILNDADALAAGIAATRRQLDKLTRVWFLGNGVGFGRYPQANGVGEGGHIVVTLDLKERFCQCGGMGHLEGIMGHRAMRLRFLDLEPEEVFELEKTGDPRCVAFVELWHRALAAAIANSIHLDGPGKFFISGPNVQFVHINLVQIYLHEMVKMSPLQGSALELISTSNEIGIVGAAVSAERAAIRGSLLW